VRQAAWLSITSTPKSAKLANVCYDIRGPVLARARQMEEEGHKIIKLNIGNLAALRLRFARGDRAGHDPQPARRGRLLDSKGIFAARKAVMHYTPAEAHQGRDGIDDIYIGNGVSELIVMAMNALLDSGDEVLVPAPDYPLWTAAVSLSGGTPRALPVRRGRRLAARPGRHPRQDHAATRAIVIINPNNPTGALYPDELLQGDHRDRPQHDLIIFADEVYDKVLYDGATHTSIARWPRMC
jgi:alanine-synthesizing transaminase